MTEESRGTEFEARMAGLTAEFGADPLDGLAIALATCSRDSLLAALVAAIALHKPVAGSGWAMVCHQCSGLAIIDEALWPCPTLTAISRTEQIGAEWLGIVEDVLSSHGDSDE